ncbi:hypothetical protein RsTz2092_10170 [Deferribacterales bacterium RsTz2092]|nr:hypothetical protein AGMMS49941_08200 [Deferribacterales bacterium]
MSSPIDTNRNVALVASAGTGKTYNLALRAIVAMLRYSSDVPLQNIKGEESGTFRTATLGKILCITFTRKATAEMSERIHSNLAKFADGQFGENDSEYKAVADVLGIADPAKLATRAKRAQDALYNDPSRLQVCTIDSFVNTILRLFPFESGVSPAFQIVGDERIKAIKREVFNEAFNAFNNASYEQLFNDYIAWQGLLPVKFIEDVRSAVINHALDWAVTLRGELERARKFVNIDTLRQALDEALACDRQIRALIGKMLELLTKIDAIGERKLNRTFRKGAMNDLQELADGKGVVSLATSRISKWLSPTAKPLTGKDDIPDSYTRLANDPDTIMR